MTFFVFQSDQPVCLIGGGAANAADLAEATRLAPRVVAADGGAELALRNGLTPELVIGDFDSLSPEIAAQLPPDSLHPVTEQDSTDFEKALRRITAPLIIGVGFTGARIDHELAVLSTLLALPDQPCVLLAEREVIFHCPPCLKLDLPADAVVSLFPMRPVRGRSHGLKWPLDGLELAPGGRVGTSNRALGGAVKSRIFLGVAHVADI